MAQSAKLGVISVVNRIAEIAASALAKITWFVVVGLIASASLCWEFYSTESALWWNLVKCGVIAVPALICALVWFLLNQLRAAPELIANLAEDEDGVFANLDQFSLREPDGLRGVVSSLKEFREDDGLGVVFDTIGGVALIVNPLFALLTVLAMIGLLLLILVAPFVMLF